LKVLAVGIALLFGATGASAESPELNYMLQCQGCHLPDGSGTPGKVPALAGSMARFGAVPGGREFLVRVPGSAQSPLDDADLAELLNWMLRRFGPAEEAADFAPYSADEVARLRRAPLTDVDSVRRDLLEELRDLRAGPGEDG